MLKHKYISILCISVLTLLIILSFFTEISSYFYFSVIFLWLSITIWGVFDIKSCYFINTICSNPTIEGKKIAITFDDGPHEMTEKVLEVLAKYNAKATFFCVGSQIEKHQDIFKKIIQEGHIVGNHSYSHSDFFGFFSTQKVFDELQKTNDIIRNVSGKKVNFFRPPFGVTNPKIRRAISLTKHKVIGWNIRSLDTVIKNEIVVFERVKRNVVPGGIILFHDTSLKSVNVLEQLLLFLQSENYEVITIDVLLNSPAYED